MTTSGKVSADQLREAQRFVGGTMAVCLSYWFAPVVGGVLCNFAEKEMVKKLLTALGIAASAEATDALFWVHRKRMLAFNVATYAPWVGTSLQLLEVYSLGQFVIACAMDDKIVDLADEPKLAAEWDRIEQDILSGRRVVESYEQFTNDQFPVAIRDAFVSSVDTASAVYRTASKIPGFRAAQDAAGEGIRRALRTAGAAFAPSGSATTSKPPA